MLDSKISLRSSASAEDRSTDKSEPAKRQRGRSGSPMRPDWLDRPRDQPAAARSETSVNVLNSTRSSAPPAADPVVWPASGEIVELAGFVGPFSARAAQIARKRGPLRGDLAGCPPGGRTRPGCGAAGTPARGPKTAQTRSSPRTAHSLPMHRPSLPWTPCGHLWPDDDTLTRTVIDAAFGPLEDSLRTRATLWLLRCR